MPQGVENKLRQSGILLRAEREKRGWTQRFIANQIGTTELSVGRWERGETAPRAFYKRQLCTLFELSPVELGLEEPRKGERDMPSVPIPVGDAHRLVDPFLPPLLYTLIGRDTLFHQIRHQLCTSSNSSCIALYGLPGVGKTALAVALAHDPQLQAHFRDGVLWASADPSQDAEQTLVRWGTFLGISSSELAQLYGEQEKARALRSVARTRRILFIVDDVYSINTIYLTIGGPYCRYLLTTRFSHVAIEIASTNSIPIPGLNIDDGTALLTEVAPQILKLCGLDVIHSLVRMVGGLPLALVLVGQHLRG